MGYDREGVNTVPSFVFVNPGGFKLIVVDQLATVLANLCGFKLIVADQFARVHQSSPFPSEASNLFFGK